tara:strand:+ start:787 stop:1590 length:804 start_codon:yes stop_codon:yes gene_type:complete
MDVMTALGLAKKLRAQSEMGDPMDRSEMEGFGIPVTDPRGPEIEMVPISQLSQAELNRLGISRRGSDEALRRMESSAAFPESDPMTGMTDSEAFPESDRGRQFDRMSVQPGGRMPAMTPSDSMGMMEQMRRAKELQGPMVGADMPAMARGDFMEDLTQSTDYGNAYADTIRTRTPDTFESAADLADVPAMYDTAIEKGFNIFNRTGEVPPSVAVEIGRFAGLLDVMRSMEDTEASDLRDAMMKERKDFLQQPEIQDAIDDFEEKNAR